MPICSHTEIGQRSKREVVLLCLAALYLPYSWLLFIEGLWPWNAPHWTWTQTGITPWTWTAHHWLWIKLWPILPGLIPSLWFNAAAGIGRLPDWLEFLIGGFITATFFAVVCRLALRGGLWTSSILGLVFLISCLFSSLAYSFYAA